MARGDKGKYTEKQQRKAEHTEEGYKERGVSQDEAERRAWATVNKESAAARSQAQGAASTRPRPPRAREAGLEVVPRPTKEVRSESAKKAAETRKQRAS